MTGIGDDSLSVRGPGQLLAFSALDGPTSWNHGLVARTTRDPAGIEFVRPGGCRVSFGGGAPDRARLSGDFLDVTTSAGRVRGAFLDARHFLLEGPARPEGESGGVVALGSGNRLLVGAKEGFDPALIGSDLDSAIRARGAWLAGREIPAGLGDATRRTLAKALSIMKTQVQSPEGIIRHRWTTPDRWPHAGMWLWDSVFHSAGWRHVDPGVARDAISAVLDVQRPGGFVPHRADPGGTSDITQPPILGGGVFHLHLTTPAPDWVRGLLPALRANVEWILANRTLPQWGLPGWRIDGDPECRSGESGMDNSPRFDVPPSVGAGSFDVGRNCQRPPCSSLAAVDLACYLAFECRSLSILFMEAGDIEEATRQRGLGDRLCGLIESWFWDEDLGFYCDWDPGRGRSTGVVASSGFLPIVAGSASPERVRMLLRRLEDPAGFGSPFPIPSIQPSDPRFSKDMWRGPSWVNVNWMIARGLDRYGFRDEAARLREKTIRGIERWYLSHGSLFEYYDPLDETPPPELPRKGRAGGGPYNRVMHDYGWTACLYADMILSGG